MSAAPPAVPPFVLVTGNPNKRLEAERILGRPLDTHAVDLPEIQSLDLVEVLRAKGEEAWRRLRRPLVVEETGLELPALNGFPGPLVKWMLEAVGPEGIARTVHALDDPRATARCALLYRDAEGERVVEGHVSGHLVLEPRGDRGFGWDPVFVPDWQVPDWRVPAGQVAGGQDRTFAQLSDDEKDLLGHRGRAWRRFAEGWISS